MATLSRMTGKDFSGPVPEIAMPPPPPVQPSGNDEQLGSTSGEIILSTEEPSGTKAKKRVRNKKSAAAPEDGVTILGDLDTFDAGADSS
jgi:transcription factor TFIIIB component B''